MESVVVSKKDDVYLWVSSEPYIIREMSDYFTFDVPSAKFHPSYKMGAWDGKIRLLNYKDQTICVGLIDHIRTFCKEREYILTSEQEAEENFSVNEAKEFISTLGVPFEPRDYQLEAFVSAVRQRRMLLLSPTGSGMSFIIYLLMRWYMQQHDRKHL